MGRELGFRACKGHNGSCDNTNNFDWAFPDSDKKTFQYTTCIVEDNQVYGVCVLGRSDKKNDYHFFDNMRLPSTVPSSTSGCNNYERRMLRSVDDVAAVFGGGDGDDGVEANDDSTSSLSSLLWSSIIGSGGDSDVGSASYN